ncbi:hypothetical protein I4F81_003857 [Pyropia yezoensis]|uniref:Uncharacterized protein n=1 Tax=Pyropia yezoensis TaxID=2788 RepID=A0ACC3BUN7_PYRYE|nr:hypothetical protein I4F81_003857 [Neopyropia yezoensis]
MATTSSETPVAAPAAEAPNGATADAASTSTTEAAAAPVAAADGKSSSPSSPAAAAATPASAPVPAAASAAAAAAAAASTAPAVVPPADAFAAAALPAQQAAAVVAQQQQMAALGMLPVPGGIPVGMPPMPMLPSVLPPGATGSSNPHASATLYVGDLDPEVTEASLFEVFSAVGQLSSIRVCRDVVTRRSLGYGYVNFHNVADAERALDTMNFFASPATKDRPLRLMWKHRDASVRKIGQGNVYIKNLDKSINNKELYDTFSAFGNIMSCKVATDAQGQSRGFGFVHFEAPESAETAMKRVDGMLLAGRKVFVGPFLSKREREERGQISRAFTNVYVKNIDDSICTEEKLRELFEPYGEVTSIHVPATPAPSGSDAAPTPKGFAFINFAKPDEAAAATEALDGKEIATKALYVGRAQKKSERDAELRQKHESFRQERMQKYQGVNLYVKNLSDEIDDDRLRQEFAAYGTITSCKLMRDERGNSRGFGFVCFTQPEEATKAVTELNGRFVGSKPIYVALAQRKEDRRMQLEAQRAVGVLRMPPAPDMPLAPSYPGPAPLFYQQSPVGQPGVGRGQMPFAHPQYLAAMGRGGPVGARGYPGGMPQYGMPGMMPGMPGGPGGPMMPGVGGPGMLPGAGGPGMGPGGAMGRPGRQNRQRGGDVPGGRGGPMPGRGGRGGASGGPGAGGAGPHAGGGPGQQFKYTTNARNANVSNDTAALETASAAAAGRSEASTTPASGSVQLTVEMLSEANDAQQKQMLGEQLYPRIYASQPQLAAKVTGMLLEMDNAEILHLMESEQALEEKVSEALVVLHQHVASTELQG